MQNAYVMLAARLAEIADLNYSASILNWDLVTNMPPDANRTRGEHLATLGRLSHQIQTAPETRALIDAARSEVGEDPDDDRAALVAVADYDIGYFATYTIGNLLSAQLFAKAREETPGLDGALANGHYDGFFAWMRSRIHQHGRKYPPAELVRRATGGSLSAIPYVTYLREKYGAIYGL